MQNINKKAVSGVITTIILLLLVVVLVGVLSISVINLINQISLAPESSCPILKSKNLMKIQEACYNDLTNDLEITIRRNNDKSVFIENIEFIINNNESEIWQCGNACGTCNLPKPGTTRKYFFESSKEKSIILRANNCLLEEKEITSC